MGALFLMTHKSLRPDIRRWHHAFFDSGDSKLSFDTCCCLLPCGDRYVSQYGGSAAALIRLIKSDEMGFFRIHFRTY